MIWQICLVNTAMRSVTSKRISGSLAVANIGTRKRSFRFESEAKAIAAISPPDPFFLFPLMPKGGSVAPSDDDTGGAPPWRGASFSIDKGTARSTRLASGDYLAKGRQESFHFRFFADGDTHVVW